MQWRIGPHLIQMPREARWLKGRYLLTDVRQGIPIILSHEQLATAHTHIPYIEIIS